jgi:hypothetical protein
VSRRRCRGDGELVRQVERLTRAVRELQRLARRESDKEMAADILAKAMNPTAKPAYQELAASGTPPPGPGPVRPPLRVVPAPEGGA